MGKSIIYISLTFLLLLLSCGKDKSAEIVNEDVPQDLPQYSADSVRQYILRTQLQLGEELNEAVGRLGSAHAIDFCSVRAIPLTDSIGHSHDVKLTRITDKPRNPNNRANAEEIILMDSIRMQMKAKDYKPALISEGKTHYYPIITNSVCLQCHGKEDKISEFTNEVILELYANDEARGYGLNELRGLFKVVTP